LGFVKHYIDRYLVHQGKFLYFIFLIKFRKVLNMKYFNDDFLQFFIDLAPNNNKEWFDTNRKRYESSVREPFKRFVADIIEEVRRDDSKVQIEPKDAIFRINRDIRFSKDKTPYKMQVSAIVSRVGKKDKAVPGIYFEFNPENLRLYGGSFMLSTQQLNDVRYAIASDLEGFEKVINDRNFKKYWSEIKGDKIKRIPKDLKEAHEKQPLIANKQFYYFAKLSPETVYSDNLVELLVDYYKSSKPVRDFLMKALGHN